MKGFSWPAFPQKKGSAERPRFVDDEALVRESIEKERFQRGVIALDVTIGKDGIPYILEIQAKNAGVSGIEELEEPEARPHLKKLAELWNQGKHGRYQNPLWFKTVSEDKRLQGQFIPTENCPPTVVDGNFDHLFEYGRVILKPYNGYQGNGIKIFDQETIDAAHAYAEELKLKGGYVAQTFIEAKGAENAPDDLKGHQTSLRLIVPFKLNDASEPEILIPKFGYQRVARYGLSEVGQKIRGRRITPENAGVVNLALDAAPVPMSDAEYDLIKPVALEIIKRVAQHTPSAEEHKQIVHTALETRFFDTFAAFRDKYPQLSFNLYRKFYPLDDNDPAMALRFLRKLEFELSLVDKSVFEMPTITTGLIYITRARDVEDYALLTFMKKDGKETFLDVSLEKTGALKRIIENLARKN